MRGFGRKGVAFQAISAVGSALALTLASVSLNLLGDGLRNALDLGLPVLPR